MPKTWEIGPQGSMEPSAVVREMTWWDRNCRKFTLEVNVMARL